MLELMNKTCMADISWIEMMELSAAHCLNLGGNIKLFLVLLWFTPNYSKYFLPPIYVFISEDRETQQVGWGLDY